MPRRDAHVTAGVIAGVTWTLYHARNEHSADKMVEVLGGFIGGLIGGQLPDILDPPTSPHHRDVAHALVVLLGLGLASFEAHRRACRAEAAACRTGGDVAAELRSMAWLFLSGMLTGFQAGYVSHLVLDGNTKAALPLLAKGF